LKAAIFADPASGATEAAKEQLWKQLLEHVPVGAVPAVDAAAKEDDSEDAEEDEDGYADEDGTPNDAARDAAEEAGDARDDGTAAAAAAVGSPDSSGRQGINIPIDDEDEEEKDSNRSSDGDGDGDGDADGKEAREDDEEATQPVEPVEVRSHASKTANGRNQKKSEQTKQKQKQKQKKYTGPSAGLMNDMKADSTAFLKTIEDPLDAILNDSTLPAARSRTARVAGAGAGAGAGKKARSKMADHVDSGEKMDWDSDASNSTPRKASDDVGAAFAFPAMGGKAPSPLKRLSATAVGGFEKKQKKRKMWSAEEEHDLMEGVKKHGMGGQCWNNILEDPEYHFNGRSNVDLKDKHRNLVKKYGLTTY